MSGTRSSSRLKAQKRARKKLKGSDAALTTTSGERADSVGTSDAMAAPSKVIKAAAAAVKRRKTNHTSSEEAEPEKRTKRASRKKPITLEAVTDLPLDILYEIFKHLRPSDLLHLCHANKALRYTLLRPGSKGTWAYSFKAASNPRIPPCLDDGLSLPQYANLIYGKSCFVCGSTKDVRNLYVFLDRRCDKCMFTSRYCTVVDRGRSAPGHIEATYPGKKVYWNSDVLDSQKATYLVDKEEYTMAETEMAALKKGPVDDLTKYKINLKAKARRASEFSENIGRVLRIESYVVKSAMKKQIEALRTQRREFIVKKLEEQGYSEELPRLERWRRNYLNRYTHRPTPMTERSWNTMREGVEEYVSELIKFRKKEVAGSVFRRRLRDLGLRLSKWREICPDTNVLEPTAAEVAVREPLKTVLSKDLDWSVTDPMASVEDDVLVRLGRECMDEMRAYLLGLIPGKNKGKGKGTDDRLALATTYFKCFRCKEPMPYVRVVVHHCFRNLAASRDDEEEEPTAITITSMLKVVEGSVPLYQTTDKVFFDAEASRHAEMLIRACGKDAKKTNFADMEALDLRLECVACDPGKHRQAMQWRSALLHSIQHHYATDSNPISARWKVIGDPNELQRIKAAEHLAMEKGQVHRYYGRDCFKVPASRDQKMWHKALGEQKIAYAQDSSMSNFPPFVRF